MNGTTCPACGVAVVPGYVRCPKCQRALPGRRKQTNVAGGTAVDTSGRIPILPIAGGAVLVLGIILFFVLGGDDEKRATPDPATTTPTEETADDTPAVTAPVPQLPVEADDDRNRVDPQAVARDLERGLRNQRLWSSVEVIGKDVEVRSNSCRDENMMPTVDAARAALRNAGLTRVRCLENSGAVVFERGL